MDTDIITIEDVDIFYRRSGSTGIPVVFVHGNSFSSRAFFKQIESDLADEYRLFAFDMPGHGGSADASIPERSYSLRGFASVCIQFAARLGIEEALFVGWSLGGHILLEASNRLEAARGFMIFGTPPLGISESPNSPFCSHPAAALTLQQHLSEDEIKAFVDALFRPGYKGDRSIFSEDLKRTDDRIRKVLSDAAGRGEFRDEVEIVKTLAAPLAVIQGEKEQLVNDSFLADLEYGNLFENRVVPVPEAGHTPQWENSKEFNAILRRFIKASC